MLVVMCWWIRLSCVLSWLRLVFLVRVGGVFRLMVVCGVGLVV